MEHFRNVMNFSDHREVNCIVNQKSGFEPSVSLQYVEVFLDGVALTVVCVYFPVTGPESLVP